MLKNFILQGKSPFESFCLVVFIALFVLFFIYCAYRGNKEAKKYHRLIDGVDVIARSVKSNNDRLES